MPYCPNCNAELDAPVEPACWNCDADLSENASWRPTPRPTGRFQARTRRPVNLPPEGKTEPAKGAERRVLQRLLSVLLVTLAVFSIWSQATTKVGSWPSTLGGVLLLLLLAGLLWVPRERVQNFKWPLPLVVVVAGLCASATTHEGLRIFRGERPFPLECNAGRGRGFCSLLNLLFEAGGPAWPGTVILLFALSLWLIAVAGSIRWGRGHFGRNRIR
jgi:hypothetical protein